MAIAWLSMSSLAVVAAEAKLPPVETNFGSMTAGAWNGKTLASIVPPQTISRIVLLEETVWIIEKLRLNSPNETQPIYDALFAQLFASDAKAGDWGLGGNESTLCKLIILTHDAQVFYIEIVGSRSDSPTAVLIHGSGNGARINVANFKWPKAKR